MLLQPPIGCQSPTMNKHEEGHVTGISIMLTQTFAIMLFITHMSQKYVRIGTYRVT